MVSVSKSYRTEVKPKVGHLVLLLALVLLFMFVSALFLMPMINLVVPDPFYQKILFQLTALAAMFFLPVLVLRGIERSKGEAFYLCLNKPALTPGRVGQAFVLFLLYTPAVSLLTWVMSLIPVPDILIPIQQTVEAEYVYMMSDNRPLGVVLSILALAVAAPIAEEYFFRGALQGWLITRSGTKMFHIWIPLIALIFALSHFEWTGLLARFFMGIILGYTALYGGIPMSIILHAINNLVVFLLYKLVRIEGDPLIGDPQTATTTELMVVGISCLITLPIIIYLFKKLRASVES